MNGLSIIVADDVAEIVDVIAQFLEPLGHRVLRASSGVEAADLLRDHRCDLLITDVLMPDRDGTELINELKRTNGSVRILAMSGGGRSLTPDYCVTLAKALGAHAAITKPFDHRQLFEGIHRAMGTAGFASGRTG